MKRCTFCTKQIQDRALVCRYCGRDQEGEGGDSEATVRGAPEPFMELAGRYRIIEQAGRGAMGKVYRALDSELESEVDIKVLSDEVSRNRQAIEHLKSEANLCLDLTHPNIVRLYDFRELEGLYSFVMEYVGGGSLAQHLAEHRSGIPEEEAVRYLLGACRGLEHAHGKGILHLDIKPENILLSEQGEIKVADFGIARLSNDSMNYMTGQMTSGTLSYMSPEQKLGQHCDARTDIYSLGITLYELLSGELPFSTGNIAYQHLDKDPDRIEGVSDWIWGVAERMLAKDPRQRYQSMAEVRKVLEKGPSGAQQERPVVAGGEGQSSVPTSSDENKAETDTVAKGRQIPKEGLHEIGKRVPSPPKLSSLTSRLPGGRLTLVAMALLAVGYLWFSIDSGPLRGRSVAPVRQAESRRKDPQRLTSQGLGEVKGELPTAGVEEGQPDTVVRLEEDKERAMIAGEQARSQEERQEAERKLEKEREREKARQAEEKKAKHQVADPVAKVTRALGIDLIGIPGGEFMMGSTRHSSEKPVHRVKLGNYSLASKEVTQGLWWRVMGNNPSFFTNCNECPVEQVSWNQVQDFLRRAEEMTGVALRLPTEAEWEYAAGGGSQEFPGTNMIGSLGDHDWYSKNSEIRTHPVGEKKQNIFGLYDMGGNVREWCSDWYEGNYRSAPMLSTDPQGPSSGRERITRGGSYLSHEDTLRVAKRDRVNAKDSADDLGFRLAADVFPAEKADGEKQISRAADGDETLAGKSGEKSRQASKEANEKEEDAVTMSATGTQTKGAGEIQNAAEAIVQPGAEIFEGVVLDALGSSKTRVGREVRDLSTGGSYWVRMIRTTDKSKAEPVYRMLMEEGLRPKVTKEKVRQYTRYTILVGSFPDTRTAARAVDIIRDETDLRVQWIKLK